MGEIQKVFRSPVQGNVMGRQSARRVSGCGRSPCDVARPGDEINLGAPRLADSDVMHRLAAL